MAYFLGDKMINIVRIKIFYSLYCRLFLLLEDFNKGNKISIGINIVNNSLIMVI